VAVVGGEQVVERADVLEHERGTLTECGVIGLEQGQDECGDVRPEGDQRLAGGLAHPPRRVAQPRREDPGTDPGTGSTNETWQVLTIPGLPAGAVLGDLWVSPNGNVYVWAKFLPASVEIGTDTDPDGEKLPDPPGAPRPWSSALYRYDGMRWSSVLRTPGEIGNALLGSGTKDVFATTTTSKGDVRFYSFNGTAWTRQNVPGYHSDKIHTLAGVPGDLFLKIGNVVLRNSGSGFEWFYALPASEAPVRGLVYVNSLHLIVMCSHGQYQWDIGQWTACNDAYAFTDVEDAWGTRDARGTLQLYAVGAAEQDNGLRIWRFTETDPIAHTGTWNAVVADPPGAGWDGVYVAKSKTG